MTTLDKQIMIDSYRNISFHGEKRGGQEYLYYSDMLKNDLAELGDNTGNYEQKFIDKLMDFFHKQSRCASSFITGPANFPVRSNQKKMDSADKAYSHFSYWREKYFKAVNRVRTLSPEAELDALAIQIDQMELDKENYKVIKKCNLEEREKLVNDYFPNLREWDRDSLIKFGDAHSRRSLVTKIRERKKKILIMQNRIEAKNQHTDIFFRGGKIYIENDRVIIAHDDKPSREVINKIKKYGFRWSPKMGNWCRKHTAQALHDANLLLGIVFGGEVQS